jgi:hypothetical protein
VRILTDAAKIRGTNHHSFRSGEWARIIGVSFVAPEGMDFRPAFVAQYEDGKIDYIAFSDHANYEVERVG